MRPTAKQLRKTARANLKKRHWWAVLLTFITVWLGGTTFLPGLDPVSSTPSFPTTGYDFGTYGSGYDFGSADPFYRHTSFVPEPGFAAGADGEGLLMLLVSVGVVVLILYVVLMLVSFATIFTGGPIRLGYSRWCLQMHDADNPKPFATLFSGFRLFGKGMGLYWWSYLKVFLWSLINVATTIVGIIVWIIVTLPQLEQLQRETVLLPDEVLYISLVLSCCAYILVAALLGSIPAIIAQYRYCMAYYLMCENPNLQATEAVRCSIELMKGNKWRLFCLNLSFIGWELLNLLTFGLLGVLYLHPYREFAVTAFYRDLVPAGPYSQLWNAPSPVPAPQAPEPES